MNTNRAAALHVLTLDGTEATVALEAGKHGGDALVIRDAQANVLMAMKAEHVSDRVLGTVLDPGTVATVREVF